MPYIKADGERVSYRNGPCAVLTSKRSNARHCSHNPPQPVRWNDTPAMGVNQARTAGS